MKSKQLPLLHIRDFPIVKTSTIRSTKTCILAISAVVLQKEYFFHCIDEDRTKDGWQPHTALKAGVENCCSEQCFTPRWTAKCTSWAKPSRPLLPNSISNPILRNNTAVRYFLCAWELTILTQVITKAVTLFTSTVHDLPLVCAKLAGYCSKFNTWWQPWKEKQ